MLNKAINRLIFILLLVASIYIGLLVLPYIKAVLIFILDILTPFIIAFILAFILQPIVLFLQRFVKKRWISVVIVLVLFFLIIIMFVVFSVPKFISQITEFQKVIPDLMNELKFYANKIFRKFTFLPEDYQPTFDNLSNYLKNIFDGFMIASDEFLSKMFHYIGIIIMIPIILIYLLLDYEKILCLIRDKLIEKKKIRFKSYLADINKVMGSYMRGALLVMFIMFIIFSLAFLIIDLDYGIIFAFILAITNIIPYLGGYIGASLPMLYAALDSFSKALIVLGICIVVQTLESDVLTPCVQSKKTKIHPLLVILGLLFFGALFGIIGMMVAVPIMVFLKITFSYYPIKLFSSHISTIHDI